MLQLYVTQLRALMMRTACVNIRLYRALFVFLLCRLLSLSYWIYGFDVRLVQCWELLSIISLRYLNVSYIYGEWLTLNSLSIRLCMPSYPIGCVLLKNNLHFAYTNLLSKCLFCMLSNLHSSTYF